VSGDVNIQAKGGGSDGPASGSLVVTTDYQSSRANQIVIDRSSVLDNTAITSGKISIDANGYVHYANSGRKATTHPIVQGVVYC
jgi:hypothetical protein